MSILLSLTLPSTIENAKKKKKKSLTRGSYRLYRSIFTRDEEIIHHNSFLPQP